MSGMGAYSCVVLVLLVSDGIMCGLTGVTWFLQRLAFLGYLDWDLEGWILQNVSASLMRNIVI
jgi:sterol O-acyltransferase